MKVSETAAGWDMVSEVDVASLLNVVQDGQTGVLVEFCCPIHAGLTRSSGLEGGGMINIRLSTRVFSHIYKAASAILPDVCISQSVCWYSCPD